MAGTTITIGVDWGVEKLAVCAVDAQGKRLYDKEIDRKGDAIEELVERMLKLADGEAERLRVALEMPRAAVLDAFLERGVATFSLNPKQLDRFRDRHTVAGAKDDDLDAYVLADALRTDAHLFRRLEPDPEQVVLLRERSRAYEALTEQLLASANQLRAVLTRYYPALLTLGTLHEKPWIWRLLELAPTPQALRDTPVEELAGELQDKALRPARDLAEKLDAARAGKPLPSAPGVVEAYSERALRTLPILRAIYDERQRCIRELKQLTREMAREPKDDADPDPRPSDMKIVLSMAGIGYRIAAVLMSEARHALEARDLQGLRRLGGVAPITRRSGGKHKRGVVSIRRARHIRVSNAIRLWADSARRCDPRARQLYRELRERGHDYERALRGVGDRLLPMLIAALRDGQLYDRRRRQGILPQAA